MSIENVNDKKKVFWKCGTCGVDFYTRSFSKNKIPKYCSRKCQFTSQVKIKTCAHCSKDYSGCMRGKKFCSQQCAGLAHKADSFKCGELHPKWKGGKETLPQRLAVYRYKRRSQQNIKIDTSYLKRVLIAQRNQCFFCETELSNYKAIEHLTPISKGGDNDNYNLVYSCKSCNSQKRQNTLEQFAIKKRRFDWIDKFDVIYPSALYGI